MATKKRVTRKELLNEPDEFISLTGKVVRWSRTHEKEVYTGVVVVSMLLLIIMGWSFFTSRAERKATTMFAAAQEQYMTLVSRSGARDAAVGTFKQFENVAKEHPGTHGGRASMIMAAQTAYDSGDYEAALLWYEKAMKVFARDALLESRLALGLAYSYEGKGDYEQAARCYTQVLDMKAGIGREDAALGLARVYEAMGDAQKSLEAYERFVEDFPEAAMAPMAQEKIRRAKS